MEREKMSRKFQANATLQGKKGFDVNLQTAFPRLMDLVSREQVPLQWLSHRRWEWSPHTLRNASLRRLEEG